MQQWLTDVFGFKVERHEIPRAGGRPYYPLAGTQRRGCLHTTEGNRVLDAIAAMQNGPNGPDASTFLAGENRILQLRPLGVQAASLHSPANAYFDVQVEMVCKTEEPGRKQSELWLPPDATLKPAVALIAYFAQQDIVPLLVPNNWPDGIDDVQPYPSTNNSRRRTAERLNLLQTAPGWWMHLEVPGQAPSWHWDCGALKRRAMLQMATDLLTQEG